jgi:hypothetical protein
LASRRRCQSLRHRRDRQPVLKIPPSRPPASSPARAGVALRHFPGRQLRACSRRTCDRCRFEERKAALARIGKGAESWIALTNSVVGDGCALYRPWSTPTSRALSPSVSLTPTIRSVHRGTKVSIAALRGVADVPSGLASGGPVVLVRDSPGTYSFPVASYEAYLGASIRAL